ncbi:hypothetical protein HA402_009052 [Bradysia odoriphaga]|nr:hypothetical protein HA402_009052 [Bradysia odoriphaga]
MADDAACCASTSSDEQELKDIRLLLWGPNINLDIFRRWSQGFEFSQYEPSALIQKEGGPCGVIAPVQAFLLKILLMDTPGHSFSDLTTDKCKTLLVQAFCNILQKCKEHKFRIVTLPDPEVGKEVLEEDALDDYDKDVGASSEDAKMNSLVSFEWSPEEFHERLSVCSLDNIDEVEKYYAKNFETISGQYGVLLFMYTVFLTKTVENIISELLDTSEPLIHNTYGYASQGLINLMLTGQAVAHVWDHDKDVGGLKLRGLSQQPDIGFITLMEQMRYCTVGSFYKNPKNPVWIMGSETHLTVLFSNEKRLVSAETPSEIARRVFKSFDPEGNNFIPTPVLQDVLCALDLVSEQGYVDIMSSKLDPESLGIILMNAFMDEFFPDEARSMPDTFNIMHYNGLPGSNFSQKVKYNIGSAILLESDLKSMCSVSNPMLTCLQTKWPNIEVNWNGNRMPSLN